MKIIRSHFILEPFVIVLVGLFCVTFSSVAQNKTNEPLCDNYKGSPKGKEKTAGMIRVKAGTFIMGNDKGHKDKTTGNYDPFYEEKYEHEVSLNGFWIDQHEVTNAQFSKFVKATGYITIAERKPKKEWFPPGFPEEQMLKGSAVFVAPKNVANLNNMNQWWQFVEDANWRHPQGPGSDIKTKTNHPVVHVTHEDALAYAKWAGRSLPTEAQWEYAARGGLKKKTYAWGKYYQPGDKWMANTWQGQFPSKNSSKDGHIGTAPVGCYPTNGYGLFDMAGNVWEIVNDNYQSRHKKEKTNNPAGPNKGFDPREPNVTKHVIKGGSYLCTPMYCMRYRPSARQPQDYTMGTSHVGFRTVVNVKNVKK